MFGFYGDATARMLEERDRKRRALLFNGVTHPNYTELAKTLIATKWDSHLFDNSVRDVFAYQGAKHGLLKALRKEADQFPALQDDITGSVLYYILSCRRDGFGRKDDTRSLRELRAIQRANDPRQSTSLDECYEATINSQDEWDQYEFILRYEKLTDAALRQAHQKQYHNAIIAFMEKTASGTQKIRLFLKLDSQTQTDRANYEKGCAMIKARFQPVHLNDAQFASWIALFKKRKNVDSRIRLVAAADRRELLELHIFNDEAAIEFLKKHNDNYLHLFSEGKLRPLVLSACQGEMPPKKPRRFPWSSAIQPKHVELQEVVRPKK